MAKADPWAAAKASRTLREAHNVLGVLMPAPTAPLKALRDFYLASSAVYARVAEVDREHHHEATAWAASERRKAEAIARQMTTK